MYSAREHALIASKWLASFLRRDWTLSDYPVRVRRNGGEPKPSEAWVAQILNWPGPGGIGASKEEAIERLRENVESIRAQRRSTKEGMPRPGREVPIQFASTARVLANPALYDDFITRVLGFQPSEIFISDDSSLDNFGDEAHVASLRDRILQVYGVDVSDLRDGLLCEILERLRERR